MKSIIHEVWKPIDWIEGIRGTYEISNFGSVRRTSMIRHNHYSNSYQTVHKIREMTPTNNGNGYMIISFPVGAKKKSCYVHRLVARAFVPNPDNKPEVNHKDHDRANNNVNNLEWVTDKENTNYSVPLMHHPRNNSNERGIRYRKGSYEVQIYHKSKRYYVGRFKTFEEAVIARNAKDKELGLIIRKEQP